MLCEGTGGNLKIERQSVDPVSDLICCLNMLALHDHIFHEVVDVVAVMIDHVTNVGGDVIDDIGEARVAVRVVAHVVHDGLFVLFDLLVRQC